MTKALTSSSLRPYHRAQHPSVRPWLAAINPTAAPGFALLQAPRGGTREVLRSSHSHSCLACACRAPVGGACLRAGRNRFGHGFRDRRTGRRAAWCHRDDQQHGNRARQNNDHEPDRNVSDAGAAARRLSDEGRAERVPDRHPRSGAHACRHGRTAGREAHDRHTL